jgi:hypothetical protein
MNTSCPTDLRSHDRSAFIYRAASSYRVIAPQDRWVDPASSHRVTVGVSPVAVENTHEHRAHDIPSRTPPVPSVMQPTAFQ